MNYHPDAPTTLTAESNRPEFAGRLASAKVLFGKFSRYAVAAVHTRFDFVAWFVWDSETHDREAPGMPTSPMLIRQETCLAGAVSGLE